MRRTFGLLTVDRERPVDAAAINTNYATQAGLDPVKDTILREDPKGPYVNVIAVRAADKDKAWVKTLVESYRTPEVKELRWLSSMARYCRVGKLRPPAASLDGRKPLAGHSASRSICSDDGPGARGRHVGDA